MDCNNLESELDKSKHVTYTLDSMYGCKNHTIVTNNHALKGEDNMTQRMNKQMNLTMETREQIVLMVYQG